MNDVLNGAWAFVNSPIGLTIVGGIVLYLLNRFVRPNAKWAKYEGTIIAAVKYAEKAIPDGSDNASQRKLDEALKYVLAVYAKADPAAITEGIQIVHEKMEADGVIK